MSAVDKCENIEGYIFANYAHVVLHHRVQGRCNTKAKDHIAGNVSFLMVTCKFMSLT